MSMLRAIGCKVGWHDWGPVGGDVAGAHHTCRYCDKTKRVDTGKPPEAHDKSAIHT
ncbi:hypothetical protein GCM10009798_04830 [Nocardioides panacihumi]|uniref:Uncharacterized protein n=1 Tax=Nocardioides panacihumi TaxID=400774 RepID=A0ABP5BNJ9_9ACTN